jgi:hypothetical protein
MNEASTWRAGLAQDVAAGYAANPRCAAIALGGSTARGWADRHSDVELFVFWAEPPTTEERVEAVQRAGGAIDVFWGDPPMPERYQEIVVRTGGGVGQLWPYEGDEWSEHFYVRGVNVGVSGFLCTTLDGYLHDVIETFATTADQQILISAVVHGVPLHGAARIAAWQTRAAHYPRDLARAVIRAELAADEGWWQCEMAADRGERFLLAALYARMARKIVRILLGLNRVYLPDPRLKWLDRLAADLPLRPVEFVSRLQGVLGLEPRRGIVEMERLLGETLDLVMQHMPEIDLSYARAWPRFRRPLWDEPPA